MICREEGWKKEREETKIEWGRKEYYQTNTVNY